MTDSDTMVLRSGLSRCDRIAFSAMNSRAGACKDNETVVTFRARLLTWYDSHARDLPWRKSRDPYRVWLSEIMLQQTRVAAVISHYHEFLRRFPTVEKLAAARESSVLAAWSGLGYYRRARMLHAAAKCIAGELHGEFPSTADGLKQLPGIGRYTAAAVASIAFGEPVAVVDGNVERVLSRFFASNPSSGKNLAVRRNSARLLPSRRFQSGHDGAGRDCLHPARTCMPDLSCDGSVRHARRTPARAEAGSPEETRNSFRSRPPQRFGLPDPAIARCAPHGFHVGVARNHTGPGPCAKAAHRPQSFGESEIARALVHPASFHHRHRLHRAGLAFRVFGYARRMDTFASLAEAGAHWPRPQNSAPGGNPFLSRISRAIRIPDGKPSQLLCFFFLAGVI